MSESVERRLLNLLDHPTHSPFGNPIPGLAGLAEGAADAPADPELPLPGRPLSAVASEEPQLARVVRIAETLQADETVMWQLRRIGAVPGQEVTVGNVGGVVSVRSSDGVVELPPGQAGQIVVATAG